VAVKRLITSDGETTDSGIERPQRGSRRIPSHIAIIPDGNRRWGDLENVPRAVAYERAERVVFATAEACRKLGVKWLTFFMFSSENWKRKHDEVQYLVSGDDSLLYRIASRRAAELHAKNIRFLALGDCSSESGIAANAREAIFDAEKLTKDNTGPTLVLAVNYGGQQELVRAAALAAAAGAGGPSDLTVQSFQNFLYVPEMPPVDLLIRTSGERRVSNYMLWHLAYAELIFLDVLWPDFNAEHLESCLDQYDRRNRRFGR
jgi:undecaprenyl diphosphate synthase